MGFVYVLFGDVSFRPKNSTLMKSLGLFQRRHLRSRMLHWTHRRT